MDEQQNQSGIAEKVVSSLSKDFKVVGTQRVHPWFAWAIVGVVFGMALGIVYVSNQSGQFGQSQAAKRPRQQVVVAVVGHPSDADVIACGTSKEYTFSSKRPTNDEIRMIGGMYEPFNEGEKDIYEDWRAGKSVDLEGVKHAETKPVPDGPYKGDKTNVIDFDNNGKVTMLDMINSMREQAKKKCEESKKKDLATEQGVKPKCANTMCPFSETLHVDSCGEIIFDVGSIAALAFPAKVTYKYTATCGDLPSGPGTPGGNNNGGPTTGTKPPVVPGGKTGTPITKAGTGCALTEKDENSIKMGVQSFLSNSNLGPKEFEAEYNKRFASGIEARCVKRTCDTDASKKCEVKPEALATYQAGKGGIEKVCGCASGSTTTGEPQEPKEPTPVNNPPMPGTTTSGSSVR